MVSLFKKTAIGIIVIGMAGTANAAATSNMMGQFNVNGAFLGIDALSLQPRNDDLDFVTVFPNSSTGAVSTKAIPTDYDWGFNLFGGIKFGNHDDLTLDWMRLHTNDSSSIPNPTGSFSGVGESQPRWLFTDTWTNINAKVDFNLDDVSLVMGHIINFNNPWTIRYAGGLEYAQLDSDLLVQAGNLSIPDKVFGYDSPSDFKGIGPRVDGDAIYHLPYHFALFMNANAALLIGRRDIEFNSLQTNALKFICPSINFTTPHVVVPRLGLRLGASYSYAFGSAGGEGSATILDMEAGWQAETYINAIERVDSNAIDYIDRFNTQPNFIQPVTTKITSFSDQGLFFGVKLSTNW